MGCRKRKCCTCTECCNGNPPHEWLATFSFPNTGLQTCSLCESFLSGEYSLIQQTCANLCTDDPYYPATTDCCWKYDWTGDQTCTLGGVSSGTLHITEVHCTLQIRCRPNTAINEVCFLQFYFIGYIDEEPGKLYGRLWNWESPLDHTTGEPDLDKPSASKCRTVINSFASDGIMINPMIDDLTHLGLDVCGTYGWVALEPVP